jgi:hypothetical protein
LSAGGNGPVSQCRETRVSTTGKLMSTLAVSAVLMSAPNTKMNIGMTNSPPATPRRLLMVPAKKASDEIGRSNPRGVA